MGKLKRNMEPLFTEFHKDVEEIASQLGIGYFDFERMYFGGACFPETKVALLAKFLSPELSEESLLEFFETGMFKERKKLILLVAPSASGKDYAVKYVTENSNYKQVVSATTREPRYEGESCHRFVSLTTAKREMKYSIAKTYFNDNYYYTTTDDLNDADIYIIDPQGVRDFRSKGYCTYYNVKVVEIECGWIRRFVRMFKRDGWKKAISRFKNDLHEFKEIESDVIIGWKEAPEKLINICNNFFK